MKKNRNQIFASILVATTAIGPGFLTQTATFTSEYKGAMVWIIFMAIVISLVAQLIIWNILCRSEMHAQDLANDLLPGLGYLLSALIVGGGLVFNIGNVGGGALGFYTLFKIPTWLGSIITGALAIAIFSMKNAKKVMDWVTTFLSAWMIIVLIGLIIIERPPIHQIWEEFVPIDLSVKAVVKVIVTLVGGTVGGYITFSGMHRLLEVGVSGEENVTKVRGSASRGIMLAAAIRYILFFALYGVVARGISLDPANPIVDAFTNNSNEIGYIFSGVVLLGTSIVPVMGAAYTSVSFLKTFHPFLAKHEKAITIVFIAISTAIMATVGKPAKLLIFAGTVNGCILPAALVICLAADLKRKVRKKK